MKRALFPGSFDPFTIGHKDVVERALGLFDEVVIAIGENAGKTPCFSLEERKEIVRKAFEGDSRVRVISYSGLTADVVKAEQADFLLRGVRSVMDFEYERQIADANRELCGVETVLLYTRPELAHVSSSLVRDLYKHGMKKYFCILICALLGAGMLSANAAEKKSDREAAATARIDKNLTIFNDVLRQLDINYTDTLDYETITENAINEMLRQVDPYTIYVPKREDDNLKRMTTGKYAGIGALIMQRGEWVYVSDPYLGLPAQRSDVRAGDKILSVDGVDCKGKTTSEVSNMLRGKANTEVALVLERQNPQAKGGVEKLKKNFLREEIKMPTVDYAAMLTDKTAYISFQEFTEHSAKEFKASLDSLVARGAKNLIIDLRGNGGGLISEALQIVSLFVPKGTEIVTTKGKVSSSDRSYKTVQQPAYPDMPLVILTDGHSASASEITAGALQDLKRAKLMGDKTFGKGLVQNIRPIAFDGHLKVTTARYYLPSGRCIQGTGIEPDEKVTDSTKVNITYQLYQQHLFFDYATRYANTHATYPRPSELLTEHYALPGAEGDSLLADFEAFLREKDFSYETETSKYFADVLRFAEQEDLDSTMMNELRLMKERLVTTYHDALWKHRDDVLNLLEAEIVSRYYFQTGRTCIQMRRDPLIRKALSE